MVGYGHKTGIDLPHEAEGVVPSSRWKIRNFREKWYPGETISVAIGQGATTVTPLQMAAAIGGISVGGVWHQPHLVREGARLIPARHGELNQENIKKVISGEGICSCMKGVLLLSLLLGMVQTPLTRLADAELA